MTCEAIKVVRLCVLLIAFGVFVPSATVVSGQAVRDKQVLAAMDAFNNRLESLTGNIVRVDESNIATDTRKGTLIYAHDKKGNKKKVAVRVDFEGPRESLAITGGRYYMYRPGPNQAYEGPVSSKTGSKQGVPLAFIGMGRRELVAHYTATYKGKGRLQNGQGEEVSHLLLVPKFKANFKHAEIWVNDRGVPVQSKVVQENGDSTTIRISGYTENARINGDDFKIKMPKDVNRHVE